MKRNTAFIQYLKKLKNDNIVYTLYSTQKATERVQALILGE